MDPLQFHVATPVLFGEGVSGRIGDSLSERGVRRVLVVTDHGVEAAGISDGIRTHLRRARVEVTTYAEVVANPSVANVHQGREIMWHRGCEAIVAVGGGSSIDAAKAVSMLSVHDGSILDYGMGGKAIARPGPLLFAVPTTAGTGSEVTSSAVITDRRARRKFDVKSGFMAPAAALIDPLLTLSLPPALTASTGMDALCHAVEAHTARGAGPVTDSLALEAVELIGRHLPAAFADGSNREARRGMMIASTMAGMAFSNAGLGAVHGLSAPLGGRFDVPHGVANAVLLPHVMRFNLEVRRDRYARIALALGCVDVTAEAAVERVAELNRLLGIPKLNEYGVTEEHVGALAADSLGPHSNCNDNPRPVTEEDAVALLRSALEA